MKTAYARARRWVTPIIAGILVACSTAAQPDTRARGLTAVAEVRSTAETVAARFDTVSALKDEEYTALVETTKRYLETLPNAEESAAAPRRSYRLPIHAIKVSDDDGLRAADVTPQQVALWVGKANDVFAPSGIRFMFRPEATGPDWTEIRDSALNNLSADKTQVLYAAVEAAKYPDKIVVIFRNGPGRSPAEDAFASRLRTNLVVMPGFSAATTIVGRGPNNNWIKQQNIWLLAHELGHHLGLPHTFPGPYGGATDNQLNAALWIRRFGGEVSALDGDFLSDTEPDIGLGYFMTYGWDPCKGTDPVTVKETIRGVAYSWDVTPPRNNVMSYFTCDPVSITPMQTQVMYRTLEERGVEPS